MRWINYLKHSFFYVLTISLTLFFIDLLSYWFIPNSLVEFARGYREARLDSIENLPDYARDYPRFYFRSDPIIGFDIQQNQKDKLHIFADAKINIFSNELGCFDLHSLTEIRQAKDYDYFAGDSFTWGYASYENKFATVYERETDRLSVKCGVTHTGTLHQFEKFKKSVKSIGKMPRRVIIGYFSNDPSNDYAHPHTTVINGYQVDTVELDALNHLKQRDRGVIERKVQEWVSSHSFQMQDRSFSRLPELTLSERINDFLKRHSLTANLINFVKLKLQEYITSNEKIDIYPKNIYDLNSLIPFGVDFKTSPMTEKNRTAIEAWIKHSKDNQYELVFLLIPDKVNYSNVMLYEGLKDFLSSKGIFYVDIAKGFSESQQPMRTFYWRYDGHLNNEGNKFVGRYLSNSLSK